MTSENSLNRDREYEDKWISVLRGRELTEAEQSLVMFTRHTYKLCGDLFLQQGGGLIGLSSSNSSAVVSVTAWAEQLMEILANNRIPLELDFTYIDDIRQVLAALRAGVVFCKTCRTLKIKKEQQELDRSSGENKTARTARIMKDIYNSIEKDLRFTVETQHDFADDKLPTTW